MFCNVFTYSFSTLILGTKVPQSLFIRMKTVAQEKGMLFFPRSPRSTGKKPGERNKVEHVIYLVTQQLPMKEFVSLYVQRRIALMPLSQD
jgi:hypothetical protein